MNDDDLADRANGSLSAHAGHDALGRGMAQAVIQGLREAALAGASNRERSGVLHLSHVLDCWRETLPALITAALVAREGSGATTAARRTPNMLELTLVDDRQVETDIEAMRVVQRIRDAAEWEIRDYESLAEAASGPDIPPLASCVKALLGSMEQLEIIHADRLVVLRATGARLATWFRSHYAEQSQRLRHLGVAPGPLKTVVEHAPQRKPRAESVDQVPPPRPVGLRLLLQCLGDAGPGTHAQAAVVEKLLDLLQPRPASSTEAAPMPLAPTGEPAARHEPQALAMQPLAVTPRRVGSAPAGALANIEESIRRKKLEAILRRQIHRQLQGTDAPRGLRAFMLGPWVHALTETLLRHGPQAPVARRVFQCSDALIDRIAPQAALLPHDGHAGEPVRRDELLATVQEALGFTLLPQAHAQSLMAALGKLLPHEPDHPHDNEPEPPAACETAAPDPSAWIDALQPQQWLRLHAQSQWTRAQLLWKSGNGQLFLFGSQSAGRTHTMTRRTLQQMKRSERIELLEAPAVQTAKTSSAGRTREVHGRAQP